MAGKGLVSLGVDERDHRAVRARLSDRGIAFREGVMRRRRETLVRSLGSVELAATTAGDLDVIGALSGAHVRGASDMRTPRSVEGPGRPVGSGVGDDYDW